MQQIAAAGGGAAYQVTDPAQVGKVFFEALARRICLTSGCACPNVGPNSRQDPCNFV